MGKVVAMSGCLVVLWSFAAASAQPPATPGPQTVQARVAAGKAVFGASCSSDYCHGPEGDGGGAPNLRERRYTPQLLTHVITDGVPSTAMPGFNKEMTPEQIAQVVAYVLSLAPAGSAAARVAAPDATTSTKAVRPAVAGALPVAALSTPPATKPGVPAATGEVRGDPAAGRAIFFDAGQTENCRFCHTLGDRGGQVGPDLTKTATMPARDLFLSIVVPRSTTGSAFASIAVTMKDGQRFVGVKRDETPDAIRLYDTSSVPPVLRSLLKTSVAAVNGADVPAMPSNYASRYSLKQLLDLVAFVKSMDPTSRAGVTLKDLF
jgi:putative heme-binding domain-containing protein